MKTQLYIAGKWANAVRGGTFESVNPATGQKVADVSAATAEDINLAVAAAKACLHSENWGYKTTGAQRAVVLRKLGQIITSRKEELARLECLDQGKTWREAMADMGDSAAACDCFASLAEEQDTKQNEVIDNGSGDAFKTTIRHEPLGVIGAITPWNYPLLMGIWKVIPAIAAGCTIVLKPSELAPLSCLLLGEMCTEAGLPAGAISVVPGLGHEAGAALANHPDVDKIAFTGSVPTARKIMAACALGPRGISLELGGKSAAIVFEDCHIESTVDWIMTGIFYGTGQVCSATSRLLVHTNVREKILARLVERAKAVQIGNALEEKMMNATDSVMGPVVSRPQYDKIWAYIDDAKKAGVKVAYGGDKSLVAHLPKEGYYIPPTVLVDVPTDSAIWRDEIFGPVLAVREFKTEAEAIHLANDSNYGLAAAVFSANAERCERVARHLRAGIVWKNCSQPTFIQAPWGGVKQSGFGRELGRWGLEEFTSVKQITGCAPDYNWGLWMPPVAKM